MEQIEDTRTGCEHGDENLELLINRISASSTLPLQYAPKSYTHVNGFIALTVNEEDDACRRIHWWQNAPVARADIHSHPWTFRSALVLGRLRLIHYNETPHATPGSLTLYKYRCVSAYNQGGYRFERKKMVNLTPVSDFVITSGTSYSLETSEIHSVHPIEQSITDVRIERIRSQSWLYAQDDIFPYNNDYLSPESYLHYLNLIQEELCLPR
jgi:hypothetical protein